MQMSLSCPHNKFVWLVINVMTVGLAVRVSVEKIGLFTSRDIDGVNETVFYQSVCKAE